MGKIQLRPHSWRVGRARWSGQRAVGGRSLGGGGTRRAATGRRLTLTTAAPFLDHPWGRERALNDDQRRQLPAQQQVRTLIIEAGAGYGRHRAVMATQKPRAIHRPNSPTAVTADDSGTGQPCTVAAHLRGRARRGVPLAASSQENAQDSFGSLSALFVGQEDGKHSDERHQEKADEDPNHGNNPEPRRHGQLLKEKLSHYLRLTCPNPAS